MWLGSQLRTWMVNGAQMTMDRSRLEDFLAELVENESIQDSEWRGVNGLFAFGSA